MDRTEPVTGSPAEGSIGSALALACEWAGPGLVALLLGGSHATGEGVWADEGGRRITLSDVDAYAILPHDAACRAAEARARATHGALAARLSTLGIEAPLEVAFLTREGLARMAARPGTLELARHGRVVIGNPGVLAWVPRPDARAISAEEVQLLLENRAFELLMARSGLAEGRTLARLRARHALLKTAADLATVLALEAGELPDGAAARIAWARAHGFPAALAALAAPWRGAATTLDPLWDAALAWRAGDVRALEPTAAEVEWRAAALAWAAVWWRRNGGEGRDPWARALASARRAPWRRRVRRAFAAGARAGGPLANLARAGVGTPQHRVNASAAILLLASALAPESPDLPDAARAVLGTLGVTREGNVAAAGREVVRAWDRWVLDGQRTAADA